LHNNNILEKSNLIKEAIKESFRLIDLEQNDFLENVLEPISKCDGDKEMMKNLLNSFVKENLKSKIWIVNNLDSPYLKIYIDHSNDLGQFTILINEYIEEKKITVDLLFLEKLKQSIYEIGSNYFKIPIEKKLIKAFNIFDPNDKSGVESLEIEFYEENVNEIKQSKRQIKNYEKSLLVKSKTNERLSEENYNLKVKLSEVQSELKSRMGMFFFMDDNLFENYIIGDKLPELKQFYSILREYNLITMNWGYFCHCLTYHNPKENPPEYSLEISLQDSKFIKDDLGFLLYKLKINYLYESELPFLDWLTKNLILKASNGKPIDIKRFYNESIRSYSSPKNRPKNYQLISKRLTLL
jgi:hypothetical protein